MSAAARPPGVVAVVINSLARVLLLGTLGMLFWSALPTLWGWRATTVMSDSMAPSVRAGDVVVAMPVSDPVQSLGRILLVEDPDHAGRLRLHRLVGVTPDGLLITAGDANAAADSTPVRPTDVVGLAVLRAPAIGLPMVWIREGHGELALGTCVGFVVLVLLGVGPGGPRIRRQKLVQRLLPGAVALLVVAVTASTSGTSHAAYSMQNASPASSLAAQSTYSCLVETPLDSPYVLYGINEASGTTSTDASGNSRTGTVLSGATRTSGDCVSNSPSLALAGTVASGITIPGAAITPPNTFSVEIWFRSTSTRGGQVIGFGAAQSGTSTVADRRIWMSTTGAMNFSIRQNTTVRTITTTTTYRDGGWHHAIATLSTSGMRLYVDGTLRISNASYTTGYTYPTGLVGYWRVGGDTTTGMSGVSDATLVSNIDNAAVYTTALTATQVTAHYTAGR